MASSKASALPTATNVVGDALLYIVTSPSGTPSSQKISLSGLFSTLKVNVNIDAANTLVHANTFTSANGVFSANNVSANNFTITGSFGPRFTIANTPSSSSVVVNQGHFFFDQNFLYVATANNTLKRVALSSF